MGESIKALLGGWIFLAAVGALTVWFAVGMPDNALVWTLRIALPVSIFVAIMLLIWAKRRVDIAPDFLRQLVGKPFERDGVCFSIIPVVRNGVAFLNVVFQNQYANACDLRVVVMPPVKTLGFGSRQFQGVGVDLRCEGGAFGVASAPIGIPAKFQGRKTRFDVAAATSYPGGRGALLRFKNGLRVGKADTSNLGSTVLTASLLLIGHVHYHRPARITFNLPQGVVEEAPPIEPTVEALWRPGDRAEDMAGRLRRALAGSPAAI